MDRDQYLHYTANGFVIARSLFSPAEAERLANHYMAVNSQGPHPGDFAGVRSRSGADEPLKAYPRLINMHDWDQISAEWMNDPRLTGAVKELMGQQPEVLQTMVYFKPPGSRGQSFHQDNLYLRVTPVVAAWLALDSCDASNGAMEMVKGSHLLGLLPCRLADTDVSFTDSETVFPSYLQRALAQMEAGDTIFFHGLTVHGSRPNSTADRFRRAVIVHYKGCENYPIVGPPLPNAAAA